MSAEARGSELSLAMARLKSVTARLEAAERENERLHKMVLAVEAMLIKEVLDEIREVPERIAQYPRKD